MLRFIEPEHVPDGPPVDWLSILETARRLSHDNIVRTYAVGVFDTRPFIATERLDGLTLRQVIDLRREKQQRFTLDEALPIFEQMRDALMHAHRHLVHGALTAECVHILPTALKVGGFGLATAFPRLHASGGDPGGAVGLAPEILRGEIPSPSTDVFGLGSILYEMVTGQVFSADAPPPTQALGLLTDADHPIDLLIARATAEDPAGRFADVVELAEALARQVDGPPLVADGDATRRVSAPRAWRDGPSMPEPTTDVIPAHPASTVDESATTERHVTSDRVETDVHRKDVSASPEPDDEEITQPRQPIVPPPLPTLGDGSGPEASPAKDEGSPKVSAGARSAKAKPPALPPENSSSPAPGPREVPSGAPISGRSSVQGAPPTGAPMGARGSVQHGMPAGAPIGARGSVRAGAPVMGRPSAHGGASVVVDPAYGHLDTVPPIADYDPSDDRSGTVRVTAPPPKPKRSWFIRSNVGFALTLLLIVGGVAAGAWYLIQRGEPDDAEGPTVVEGGSTTPKRTASEPPPTVVVEAVPDAPSAPPIAPTAVVSPPEPAVERPERKPASPPIARVAEREAPAAVDVVAPPEPAPVIAPAPEPAPEVVPEVVPEPVAPPEPDAAVPVAPVEPEALSCPPGMTLVIQRSFPRDGRKRGRIVTPDGIAAARAGEAYCIDTYEYPGRGKQPRTSVTFDAARGLCLDHGRRLCTDREWRRACVGRKGAQYPYGPAFKPDSCNTEDGEGEERSIAASGAFRRCKSLRGVFDMSGNVAEWTADQTVRGGDFAAADEDAACNGGGKRAPGSARPSIGFRCCTDFTE